MSRVGKVPVSIPDGVKIDLVGLSVTVSGPKGKISKDFKGNIDIFIENESVIVKPKDNEKYTRSMWGTARSIISNMVKGVSQGFLQELEITGVGYRAAFKDNYLTLAVGKSHNVKIACSSSVTVSVPKPTLIELSSIDKEKLGQFASLIVKQRKTEPYKGKGIKRKGEYVQRKESSKKTKK